MKRVLNIINNQLQNESFLKKTFFCLVVFWIVLQIFICIVLHYDVRRRDDPGGYLNLAEQCFNSNTIYPTIDHLHDRYIFQPGYINFLLLILTIFGSFRAMYLVNILMNIGILSAIFFIAKRLFDSKTTYLSGIIYLLLFSNYTVVLHTYSELPFLLLMLCSFVCILKGKNVFFVLSGVSLALANWIRPLGMIALVALCAFLIFKKVNWKPYVSLLGSYVGTILIIGCISTIYFPDFVYQSTTSGVNMIMGANDDCTGGYNATVFEKGKIGYIENSTATAMTYKEFDSFFTQQSVKWIKEHPLKYISFVPKKIINLFLLGDGQFDHTY
jgi:hypothetical protein